MRLYTPLDPNYAENLELLRQIVEGEDGSILEPLPPEVPESPPIDASHTLSGPISGVLSTGDYTVVDALTVPANESLAIEPGTKLFFDGEFGLTIYGNVRAIGSSGSNIVFHGKQWTGLLIDYRARPLDSFVVGKNPIDFQYVTVKGARKFSDDPNFRWWKRGGAIHVISKHHFPPFIFGRCSFLDCQSKECGGALELLGDNSIITECSFIDCHSGDRDRGGAAVRFTHSRAAVTHCYFNRNSTLGSAVINEFDSPTARVEYCTFRDNRPNVVVLQNSGTIQEGNSFA